MPILRWKKAERDALKSLSDDQKKNIVPLFEMVPKRITDPKNKDNKLPMPPKQNLGNCIAFIHKELTDMKVLLDVTHVYPKKAEAFDEMSIPTTLFGNNLVPVLNLNDIRAENFSTNVKTFFRNQGICLRVKYKEIDDSFWNSVDNELTGLGLTRQDVDFVMDYGIASVNQKDEMHKIVSDTDKTTGWRSYFFASGAFPKDLQKITPGKKEELARIDWTNWTDLLNQNPELRLPGFSDYTIQYAEYHEPPEKAFPSYSIRYTAPNKWIIMRGQGSNAQNSAGDKQYYAHSVLLVMESDFAGASCCESDKDIIALSQNPDGKMGTPQSWIRAGIRHHIVVTLKGVESVLSSGN